jgi:hypothetical protein
MSEQSVPFSDWKSRRLRVGHHIRNKRGEIGIVTWISGGCYMYKLGSRFQTPETPKASDTDK